MSLKIITKYRQTTQSNFWKALESNWDRLGIGLLSLRERKENDVTQIFWLFRLKIFFGFQFLGIEPRQKMAYFTKVSLELRKWMGLEGETSWWDELQQSGYNNLYANFLSSSWLILQLCLCRARFQETWQKTVANSQTGEQEFQVHSAGKADTLFRPWQVGGALFDSKCFQPWPRKVMKSSKILL